MNRSWERTIPVRWRKHLALLAAGVVALLVSSQDAHGATARKHRAKPVHAAVAKPPAPKAAGAAALIAVAQRQLDAGDFVGAAEYASKAASDAPDVSDYAEYVRAQAEYKLRNFDESKKSVAKVLAHIPVSPLTGPAAALAVSAELDNNSPKQALDLIRKYYDKIPQPQAELLLARSFAASGDLAQAAERYQHVYYSYPSAKEATDAANALVALKDQLHDGYPPPLPSAMIERARKLLESGNPKAAKIELTAAIPELGGADRDLARVRLGVADFRAGNDHDALAYLLGLKVDDPEADAERLSYIIRCARKPDRHADVKPFLQDLEQHHPTSRWRMDALIFVADQARTDNDEATYTPLYQTCAATFPNEKGAAWCNWQVAFDAYRHEKADAEQLLRKYVEQFPDSADVNDALYFLGRWYQRHNQIAQAKACYNFLDERFSNTYYGVSARERLKEATVSAVNPDQATTGLLKAVNWPSEPQFPSFTPGKTVQTRLERARLLKTAGMGDLAEGELKFGARSDGEQPNVYALELATMAVERNAPDQAMHYIKAYTPGYLFMPLDQAPVQFWKLAFPMPYRRTIETYSRSENLDPYLVAALIRQESEFNPAVISHANAYGLMQLLPGTGKQLARKIRIRRFTASQLLTPDRNIQLGTMFFHDLLNSAGGQPEMALASYNAGPGRLATWRTWGPFREPAEFVETVPFHETRLYVQVVLRNADVYRRLYAKATPDVPEYHPKPAPKKRVAHPARRRRSIAAR